MFPRSPLSLLQFAPFLLLVANACSSPADPATSGGSSPPASDDAGSSSTTGTTGTGTTGGGTGTTGGSGATGDDAGGAASDDAGGATAEDASSGTTSSGEAGATSMDASSTAPATDAAASTDAAALDAAADTDAGPVVNGCTAADYALHDESGANGTRTITFAKAAPATQYVPNCMKIAKGQSVTWNGSLKDFPLEASGGTTPSPIKTTNKGNTVTFTFADEGTFGFDSAKEAKVMFGAIEVTP